MKRIDRLLVKAKCNAGLHDYRVVLAIIDPNRVTGGWIARAQLWDGAQANKVMELGTDYSSIEDATVGIYALAEQYQCSDNIPIIVDDIPYRTAG